MNVDLEDSIDNVLLMKQWGMQEENLINQDIKQTMNERLIKITKNNSDRQKQLTQKNKIISMLVSQLFRKKTFEEKPLDALGAVKTSSPSQNKLKQAVQSPGDVLIKLLQAIDNDKEKKRLIEVDAEKIEKKKGVINNIKAYQFGSGEVKEFSRDAFYVTLEAFETVYNTIIKEDLEQRSRSRNLDFQSLLKLIRLYLQKILSQFSNWGIKEMKAVDEIILRTEKSYFANKLKKKFLSDKKMYQEMDVFKRLNEIEVVSLTRLFQQIKYMLLNRKESYISTQTAKPKQAAKIHNVILEADVEGALKLESDLQKVGKVEKDTNIPLLPDPTIQPPVQSAKKAPVIIKRKRTHFDSNAMIYKRESRREMNKMIERDQTDVNDFVNLIIHKFVLKYLYTFPSVEDQIQQISLSKEKKKKLKMEKSVDIMNYKISIIRKSTGNTSFDSNSEISDEETKQNLPVIKEKNLVFELIERKRTVDLSKTARYRVHPWKKQSLSHIPQEFHTQRFNENIRGQSKRNLLEVAKSSEGPSSPRIFKTDFKSSKGTTTKYSMRTHEALEDNFELKGENYSPKIGNFTNRTLKIALSQLLFSIVSNKAFMKKFEEQLREKLSPECLQAIAIQDTSCFIEMRKKINEVTHILVKTPRQNHQKKSSITTGSEMLDQLNYLKKAIADGQVNRPGFSFQIKR